MVTRSRKRSTSGLHTPASRPPIPFQWRQLIKPMLVVFALLTSLSLYHFWTDILERLDQTPIKSYALTHKTRFTTSQDIREILDESPMKGYFAQDVEELKQRFLKRNWIKDIIVRKIYPNKLSITIWEHQPVARWNAHRYLSDKGVVFDIPEGRFNPEGLPFLFGPDTEGKILLEGWAKIEQELKLRNLTLRSVEMDNRGAWTIILDQGISLRLGKEEWLPKIDRFIAIFPQIDVPEDMRLSYVDLRYKHGIAIGFVKK